MKLKHPCVGLLQGAVIFEKTKELLTLTKVLEKMPDVTFYWVGDGPYRDDVLPILEKFDNFKWLGALEYPDKVRDFLTEIDVYALLSGIDMSPLTLLEAQLMEKPVIATNVGGIPELMKNNETGFLIEKSDHQTLIEKLELILNDSQKANSLGKAGRKFVSSNFDWKIIAKNFVSIANEHAN
jgi:glycosyltransferase involved in cell wall biosynthesis